VGTPCKSHPNYSIRIRYVTDLLMKAKLKLLAIIWLLAATGFSFMANALAYPDHHEAIIYLGVFVVVSQGWVMVSSYEKRS